MAEIESLFWRGITVADFFNIERNRRAAPSGGGGQSYISISFRGVSYEELGRFLGVAPPSRVGTDRPTVLLSDVAVLDDPALTAPLEFASRYRPPSTDDRYRIAKQNRQFQDRHPAWTGIRGFPEAPDDVVRRDPRIPDLTHLKIYVARLDSGEYVAGFVNTGTVPASLAGVPGLDVLFEPYDEQRSAGLIEFTSGAFPLDALREANAELVGAARQAAIAPDVLEAIDSTRAAAGKRTTGQRYRLDPKERRAVELHAMDVVGDSLKSDGWSLEDVSATRPYDFHCTRGHEELRVEVKGTVGDGSAILLTPGEVKHAHEHHPDVRLMIVKEITLRVDEDSGEPVAEGGELLVLSPWEIDSHGDLHPTGFEYRLH